MKRFISSVFGIKKSKERRSASEKKSQKCTKGTDLVYSVGIDYEAKDNASVVKKISLPNSITVKKVSAGRRFAIFLTDEGHVYGIGDNTAGMLGLENTTYAKTPTRITKNVSDQVFADVYCAASNTYSILRTETGTLYAMGSSNYSQIGLPQSYEDVRHPTQIPQSQFNHLPVTHVGCCFSSSVVIADNKHAFCQGQNWLAITKYTNTCVPVALEMKSVFAPLQTPIVADIQTGVFHTIILTDTGDCYSGGDVESYKLGYSSGEFSGFRRVDTLIHPVKLIRAIDNMSVFVTVYDEIFVCGRSSQGLLGLPNTVNMLTKITLYNARGKIDFNPPIVDIQLGQYHSFVIGEDNQVYGHGNNDNRNLLNNDIGQNSVMKLTNVEGFLDSTGVTLGRRIGLACGDKYTIVYFTENDRAVERHFMKLNLIRHMDQLVDIEIVTHH